MTQEEQYSGWKLMVALESFECKQKEWADDWRAWAVFTALREISSSTMGKALTICLQMGLHLGNWIDTLIY